MTSVPGIQLAGLSSSLATPGSGRFFYQKPIFALESN
jgi:hypothetical protein